MISLLWCKSFSVSCCNLVNNAFNSLSYAVWWKKEKHPSYFFSPHCCSNVKNPPWKLTKTSNQGLEILALWWWGWELTRNHKQAQEVWQPNLFFNSITALNVLSHLNLVNYRKSRFFLQTIDQILCLFLRNFYNSKLIL